MRILMSAAWLGGAGGAERALYSMLRALDCDQVDVVVRQQLAGKYAEIGPNVRVFSLYNWRWRWANLRHGAKGHLVQAALNPIRRQLLPHYDIYLQLFHGADLNDTVRASTRLIVPSGYRVNSEMADRFDAVALQAPDNCQLVERDTDVVLLPPPVFPLAERSIRPRVVLPEKFYLTVFNAYGPIKGADDLGWVAASAPHPIVWCHSSQTMEYPVPELLREHPNIVRIENASPEELRFLYEACEGYVSVSQTEGFGWSLADALRYSPRIYSRKLGVLSFPEPIVGEYCDLNDDLQFDWRHGERSGELPRELPWLSAAVFREAIQSVGQHRSS